jgi:hypothetical protein
MPQHSIPTDAQSRDAAASRDSGMAKVTALTWRAGAAGVVAAGLLAPQQAAGTGQVTSGAS